MTHRGEQMIGSRTEVSFVDNDAGNALLYQEFGVTGGLLFVYMVYREMCWCCGGLRTVVGILVECDDTDHDLHVKTFSECELKTELGPPCNYNQVGAGYEPCECKGNEDANCHGRNDDDQEGHSDDDLEI